MKRLSVRMMQKTDSESPNVWLKYLDRSIVELVKSLKDGRVARVD